MRSFTKELKEKKTGILFTFSFVSGIIQDRLGRKLIHTHASPLYHHVTEFSKLRGKKKVEGKNRNLRQ